MTETNIAFDVKRRKIIGTCSTLWTITGAVIALTSMSSVNRDARTLVMGATLLAALAGVGASIAALRGSRRLAILLLLVSALYPTYFLWPFNLMPLALAAYLVFLPRRMRT